MPDLSKIKLDGITYNLKDSVARDELEKFIHVYGTYGEGTGSIILSKEAYGENPYPYQYWYSKQPTLILLDIRNDDGDQEHMGLYLANMEYYILTLKQLDGNKIFESEHVINKNLDWNNPTIVYDKGTYLKDFNGYVGTVSIDLQTNIASFSGITFSQIDNALSNNLPVIYKYYCGEGSQEYKIYYLAYSYYNNSLHYIFYNLDFDTIHQIDITYSNQLYNQSTDEFTGTLSSITIPQISDWAKASTKPTYTAAEVGALPDTTVIPTKINDLTKYKNFGIGYIDCTNVNRYIFVSNVTFSSSDASDFSSYFLLMFIKRTESGSITIAGTGNFKFYDINSNTLNGYVAQISSATIATLKYGTLYIARLNDGELDLYPLTTKSEVNSLITSAIGNINSFEVSVVASLPTSDIDTHTIYFVSNLSSGDSIYDEYMYINNSWEKIGSTAVDLSNYLQKTDISDWAKQATKPAYTASEVGAIADTEPVASITQTNIDNWTKKSNLFTVSSSSTDNDYWWELKIDRSNLFAFTNAPGSEGYLRSIDLPVNNGNTYATIQFPTASGKLALVSDIYSVVPDWARANTKPTYTASEVGAATSDHTHTEIGITGRDNRGKVATTSESVQIDAYMGQGGSSNITLKPGKIELLASAKGSTNSTTSIIFSTESYGSSDEIQHIKLSDGATTINGVVAPTTNDMAANKLYVDNKFSSITPASIGALPSSTVIPTVPTDVSAFNNDAGYLTSFTETDPTVPAWAKAASKPTYTASEVGAAASNHTHTEIGTYNQSGDGYVKTSINHIQIAASTNGGGTQNILELTGTTTTIHKVVTPTADGDAANKKYVDDAIAAITHPTNVSTFTNDAGYLTLADLPIYDGTVV